MTDLAREYGKMAGLAAAGAFLLSLLTGLVSRHPFGVALGRAFLFAFIFAALGAAARFLFLKYLPHPTSGQPVPEEPPGGQNIDITLPEESPSPAARAAYQQAASVPGAAAEGPEVIEEASDADAVAPPPVAAQEPEAAGLGEDLDAILPPLTGEEAAEPDQPEEGAEAVEEAESVSDETPEEASDAPLGTLPDFSVFGPAEPGRAGSPAGRGGAAGEAPASPEEAMRKALGSKDPATLARAIHTVLKRDEKG